MTIEERAERLFLGVWASNSKNPAHLRGEVLAAVRAVRAEAVEEAAKVLDEQADAYLRGEGHATPKGQWGSIISRVNAAAVRAIATTGKETK